MYPTWQQVNIPENLVQSIKELRGITLDVLLAGVVFSRLKKPHYRYTCGNCGYNYQAQRATEEYNECITCASKKISCQPNNIYLKDIASYKIREIIAEMHRNYVERFKSFIPVGDLLDCGWIDGNPYAKFLGGDKITSPSPRECILKAAILCPYLWEDGWKEIERIPHLLFNLINPYR